MTARALRMPAAHTKRALEALTLGVRVAHREDHDWNVTGGEVVALSGLITVRWDDGDVAEHYDRGDLVAPGDYDNRRLCRRAVRVVLIVEALR